MGSPRNKTHKTGHTPKWYPLIVFGMLSMLIMTLLGCGSHAGSASLGESISAMPPPSLAMSAAASSAPAGASKAMESMPVDYTAQVAPDSTLVSQFEFNTEEYDRIVDNPFLNAKENPVSTFSIDVDTASYANIRRYLMENRAMPPKDAVRIEEMVNYFIYDYPDTTTTYPVAVTTTMATAPWNADHWLLRVALKAKEMETEALPPSNLVFLLDTSGSMADSNKLPLLKESLQILVGNLRPQDMVSIVAYAGSTGLILEATPGSQKETIINAFRELEASGSTAGGEGIELAYKVAKANFIKGGNNRVILCTDGDFNVGVSSTGELERMVEEKRQDNIYLTVLGLGMGNYKDSRMETLADKGNGNYAYIDNLLEGKKVLGKEIWGNLFAVAKDVKIQMEYNPAMVRSYRLIGYENRMLSREDFNDDTKDAGEMGAGQTVTAFYEIIPQSAPAEDTGGTAVAVDPLVFQQSTVIPSDNVLLLKLRYKTPSEGVEKSELITSMVDQKALITDFATCDADFRFATAVVEFGMLLRESPYRGDASWQTAMERARYSKGADLEGYRSEFVRMVELAQLLALQ
ncbi:MAG: von Willebrand factor type A domain-containing protein [Sphaerochaetaceae bacterium]